MSRALARARPPDRNLEGIAVRAGGRVAPAMLECEESDQLVALFNGDAGEVETHQSSEGPQELEGLSDRPQLFALFFRAAVGPGFERLHFGTDRREISAERR